jgi:peptide/nickel transport system substrate-binding protein
MRLLALTFSALVALAVATPASAKDTLTIGINLEPPHLDPTTDAPQAIDSVVYQNIFQGLTRIDSVGNLQPSLAESWEISDDGLTYTFHLKQGVKFHDGTDFEASDVVFSWDRARGPDSINAQKQLFAAIAKVEAKDPATVVVTLTQPQGDFLYNMGWGDAVIVAPESAADNKTHPIGTGPYKFADRVEGDSVTLVAAEGADVAIKTVTFRVIADPSAQVNALLAGDIDYFPGFQAAELLARFEGDSRFKVTVGSSEGETLLSMNNADPVLQDVRVRRAICYAIDRQELLDGIYSGYGTPIGSHFAPHNPAYVDLTGIYPHDLEKAKALLAEAGYGGGLKLTAKLPPVAYARRGGEIIAAQLAKAGITVELIPMEWAQWVAEVFKGSNYQLTIVSHTEPNDIGIYDREGYYFNYKSDRFHAVMAELAVTTDAARRTELLQQAQRILAEDAVVGFLFELPLITIADAKLKGYWQNAPIAATPLAEMSWSE